MQPQLTPEGISIHLSRSASADQGIDISSVKIFSFLFGFLLYSDFSTVVCCVITACGLYNRDAPGRIQCLSSAAQALTYQNGDYMGSPNKKASGAQCFIMALGLFWDIVTGLP